MSIALRAKPNVVTITQIEDLRSRHAQWRELLTATSGASFFQTPDWFEVYWKHHGDAQDLRFLWLNDESTPAGMLPLVRHSRQHRIGRLRTLAFPLDNWGTTYGPIGPTSSALMVAAIQHIVEQPREWDLLELNWLPAGEVYDAMVDGFRAARLVPEISVGDPVSIIELPPSWIEYWRTRTSKWRNNVLRSERRLMQAGQVGFEHYRPDVTSNFDPRWDLYEQCLAVAAASWQADSTSGTTLVHDSIRNFLQDAHATAARSGAVSMHLLYLDEQPVAFAYNYVWQGAVYGLRAGYDPKYAEFGPGSVLLARVIQDAIARRDHVFDLGESPAWYKRYWANQTQTRYCLRHYSSSSMRAQAVRLSRSLGKWLPGRTRPPAP